MFFEIVHDTVFFTHIFILLQLYIALFFVCLSCMLRPCLTHLLVLGGLCRFLGISYMMISSASSNIILSFWSVCLLFPFLIQCWELSALYVNKSGEEISLPYSQSQERIWCCSIKYKVSGRFLVDALHRVKEIPFIPIFLSVFIFMN